MSDTFGSEIFKADFDFLGPHLVAASAGTGKTYNIQNICARLVAEKGFRVSQIQVMTFTEAATKELRDRVRKVLVGFGRYLKGKPVDEGERERMEKLKVCVLANVTLEDAQTNLETAVREFDQAAISTIHGFCRRVLARYALETGNPFETELGDADSAELERRARDWWRTSWKTAPESFRDDLKLSDLISSVRKLSSRAGYGILADETQGSGYLLARAREIALSYQEARLARSTQTFDDLLMGLKEALADKVRGPILASHLRKEFKAALVDEFQDTDPVQFEIFKRVFLDAPDGAKPPLFFVGDPKQAIYSFRGGDIYTYRSAALRPDVKERTFRLDQNFRSTAKLIEAVNALFRDRNGTYTFGDETIDYKNDLKWSNVKPLVENGKEDPSPFRILDVKGSGAMPDAVVNAVLELLNRKEKDVEPKDIAILVTSHEKARDYFHVLRNHGVPAVLQKSGNVFATEVASEFRTVLQAMSLEGGVQRARAALATRFFDISVGELVVDEDNNLVADMLGFFAELNSVWLKRGFDAAFKKLESHDRCRLRARFAAMRDGERCLADILQIRDLALNAIREIGPTPEALVGWLTDRINQSGEKGGEEDSEEYARELESEADTVRIMTIHVSKGLEFPIVILPLPGGAGRFDGPFVFHDNGQLVFSPSNDQPCKGETTLEGIRKLYVAMTRATKRTIVLSPDRNVYTWPYKKLFENVKAWKGKDGFPVKWTAYEPPETPYPRYEPLKPLAGELTDVPDDARSFARQNPSKGSYSSLAPSAHEDADGHDYERGSTVLTRPADEGPGHPIFKICGGAEVGICWHEILEKIPFDADDSAVTEQVRRSMRLHGRGASGTEKFDSEASVVSEMIAKTLRYELVDPNGTAFRLSEVEGSKRRSEWEFNFSSATAEKTTEALRDVISRYWRADDPEKKPFLDAMMNWKKPIPDGFMKGFLDLVFQHGDYFYIVDWKSNILNRSASGFDKVGVTEEMAEAGYFFQYLLYSVVLHRFLKETLEGYSWEKHFGGVRYYFLRGIASDGAAPVFADRPPEAMLDELAAALGIKEG